MASARRHRYGRGEVIFHEGDLAETIHFVAEGRVAARRTTPAGDSATFAVMGRGEAFGEMAMLSPSARRTSTVSALEPTVTLTLRYADFDRLRRAHPAVERLLVDVLAERVLGLSDRLVEALYLPADVRVLRRLDGLCDQYGEGDDAGAVRIPLTQTEIGELCGASRATTNRVLQALVVARLVTLRRGGVEVPDRERLHRRAVEGQ